MKTLFASGREYLNQDDWTVESESGGNLTAGTYHFSLQAKTLIGRNYLIKKSITISLNSSINITVLPTALATNENWTTFIIGYSSTGLDQDYIQITELRVKEIGNPSIQYSLPLSITINNNSELNILTVADHPTLLANSSSVNKGRISYIDDLENYYQYVKDIYTEVDNTFILSSNNPNYKWKYIQSPYCYLQSLNSSKGCNQEVRNYQEDFEFEGITYTGDGSYSLGLDYLILPEDTYSTKFIIDFGIFAGSLNLGTYFKNKISYLVKGIYNTNTNILRTLTNTLENLVFLDYIAWDNTKTEIEYISDTLTETEGFLVSVKLKFYLDELLLNIPDNSYFRILPYLKTDISIYNNENYLSYAKGLLFYSPQGNYLRVLPNGDGLNLKASKGLGIINGFSFPLTNEIVINSSFIPTNQKDIIIKINQNGSVYYSANALTSNESIRAVISTEVVESDINILFPITGLTLTITHPNDVNNLAVIREDYPDVIRGQLAYFNPTGFNLYIKNLETNEVKLFSYTEIVYNVNLIWLDGISVTNIPVKEVTGFFQVQNIVSNLYAGSYLAGIAYTYDGSTVSAISHSPLLGCILELPSQYSTSAEIEALLGTAAFKDYGTAIGDVIEVVDLGDGTEALPVLDGSQLTGIDKINTEYKNSSFNAFTNTYYLVDTALNSLTAYLPTNALNGKKIVFADYAGTTYKNPTGFGKNSLIIDSQGLLIQGETELEIDLENANVTVIFINNTWRLYTDFNQIQTSQTFNLTGSGLGLVSPLEAKGDIWTRTITGDAKKTIGTTGQFLTVDPNDDSGTGLKWVNIPELPTLATVATSGNYNDLINRPTIPTLPTLATVATSGLASDLTGLDTAITNALPEFKEGAFLDAGDLPTNLVQLNLSGKIDASLIPTVPVDSPLDTQGDIWTHTASGQAKRSIGTTGQFLTVDLNDNSGTGLAWTTVTIPTLPTLATVATTGNYNDLTNKPSIVYETLSSNLTTSLSSQGKIYLVNSNKQITLTTLTENIEFVVRIIDGTYTVTLVVSSTTVSPSTATVSQRDKPFHLGYNVSSNVWYITGVV